VQWHSQGGPWPPNPWKIRIVGNGGPITGCLIHRIIKYTGLHDDCVRFSFAVLPFHKKLHFVVIIFLASSFSRLSWPWFPFPLSVFFLALFSYHVLCQQCPVSSIYHFFPHSSPTLSRSLLMPHRNFSLPRLHFPSTFWACALFDSLSSLIFSIWPAYTPRQFLLRTFVHPHFNNFLLSALFTPTIILTRLFFHNFLCVYLPSPLHQAFAPVVILVVTKTINLVDFALGKCYFLLWIYKL